MVTPATVVIVFTPVGAIATIVPKSFFETTLGNVFKPNLFTADWSLSKKFHFAERKSLDFRWETFNTFNHTNPICCASTSFASTSFNLIRSTRDPRIMQLGMKLSF